MIIINCEQGTPEWLEARRCKITGTKMDSVCGSDLDRLMLACELIAEEATEQTKAFKATAEMERGTAEEVFARKHFMETRNVKVEEIGFCISEKYDYLGVSGDGWIANDKGIYTGAFENKSPDSKNAVFYKLADLLPPEKLGLGSWSTPTAKNPYSTFKPSAKAPFLGVPAQYKSQIVTYFLVNDDLEELFFSVYDDRFIEDDSKQHIVTIRRDNEVLQDALREAEHALVSFRAYWLELRSYIIKSDF